MSSSNFTVGYGSSILVAPITAGTVGTYVKIAQSKDLNGPEPEVGDINITNNDSPNNTKEGAPGMIDPSTLDFELVYTKAQAATLYGMFGDGATYAFRELLVDGSKWEFNGWIKKFGTEGKTEDDAITNKVTLKVNTKPVFTPGT